MNRSNIDLLGNSTNGINIGNGSCIFKCKNITGNTLQFKTISVAGGSLSIITGDTTITICGAGGTIISGATDYIPKFNSTCNNIINGSILDSGATNIHIFKQKIIGRCNTIGLVATNGAFLGTLSNCIFSNGISLCSGTYCNLSIVAGSCVSSGCVGKILYLCGGAGTGAVGGNVVICAGAGSSIGRVQTPNLPVKSTETCAVYIDASGNLSKGIVGTGSTTIIGGIAAHIPIYISGGNNISGSTFTLTGNTLCNNSDLFIKAVDGKNIYLAAKTGTYNYTILGSPTQAGVSTSIICVAGTTTDVGIQILTKGNGIFNILAPTVSMGPAGPSVNTLTFNSLTLTLPQSGKICAYGGNSTLPDATPLCILGGNGYNTACLGNGGHLCIVAGCAQNTLNATPKIGGDIVLKSGLGICGGANGRIQLCGLPVKTTESCVVYIDSTGKLSTGISSGGTGGLSVAVTGATNGICLYNNKNVCLGGTITSLITLTATGATNGLNLCSTNGCTNKTTVCSGLFTTCTYNPVTSFCGCIINCGEITLTSKNSSTCNYVDLTPDYEKLGNINNYLCATASNIAMYNMAGTACLNTFTACGTQMQAFSADPIASKFAMTTWSSVTPSVCLAAVNATCSVEMCIMPNSLTVHGCATFQGIQYVADYSANYIARSLVDCGYVNTKFAPICNPIFTGTVTAPVIKLTTGAAAGCVLTSAADGTASWQNPTGGLITPANCTDAGMPNNSIYFSTTSNKLVYKDAGGVVNVLY